MGIVKEDLSGVITAILTLFTLCFCFWIMCLKLSSFGRVQKQFENNIKLQNQNRKITKVKEIVIWCYRFLFMAIECCKRPKYIASLYNIALFGKTDCKIWLNISSVSIIDMKKAFFERNINPWIHLAHFCRCKMNEIYANFCPNINQNLVFNFERFFELNLSVLDKFCSLTSH